MDTNQHVLQRPNEDRTISGIHAIVPSSSRKKGTKEYESGSDRGETNLQIICKIWKELDSSVMGYGCTNISLHQTSSIKIRSKIDQANKNNKYGHSKWPEKSNLKDNRKCLT